MGDTIIESMALWLGIPLEKIEKDIMHQRDIALLKKRLDIDSRSILERQARKLVQIILNSAPTRAHYILTSTLKKILLTKCSISKTGGRDVRDWDVIKLYQKLKSNLSTTGIKWANEKKGVVCITHDVDFVEGYDFVEELVGLEKKYNIRSTYNFLIKGRYRCERGLLQYIIDNGFEVGLHGYTHDIALSYRSPSIIRRDIEKALSEMDFRVMGFRTPALSISKNLLTVLKELNFKYDSSLASTSSYWQGVETCFPFRYPGMGIWEVPLCLQDSTMFRDHSMNDEDALQLIKKMIGGIIEVGGVAVINLHPCILKNRMDFYHRLLDYIKDQHQIWVIPVIGLIDFLERRIDEG
ncbi:MAG: polysaccharide deacetylase family protein [Desulfobacterales bacterium]|nr:polysaccharide deacetylase family protein [Desulfobacterales bacterium]